MYVARILYPVRVLGPGNRIGIWFSGCPHRCPGCSNPELWEPDPRHRTTPDTLLALIAGIRQTRPVDGFTLTGGDPFAQPEALARLLPELEKISEDILIYTGFDYETLRDRYPELLARAGVVIDGPYVEARNLGLPLRGSDNQRILVLRDSLRDRYGAYLASAKNEIQNFTTLDGIVSVGIHAPGYEARLESILKEKGLEHHGQLPAQMAPGT